MTRLTHAWRAMAAQQRLVALAAVALLVTMFFPWYGLQSLNRKTGVLYSHNINAFGDVSFVEAAIFVVALGVGAIVLARAEGREFHLPGGDGLIVMLAGCWAGLLIFYRVFSRPAGGGYPVGIEWGFFLAFVAAGILALAGWRMRAGERPEPPLRTRRARPPRRPAAPDMDVDRDMDLDGDVTIRETAARSPTPVPARPRAAAPTADRRPPAERSPYPPAPAEQLSFEDPPSASE